MRTTAAEYAHTIETENSPPRRRGFGGTNLVGVLTKAGIALGMALSGAVVSEAAQPAAAATTTLHIFSKGESFQLYHNGQRVQNQNTPPAVGDYFISTGTNYSGTSKNHSKTSNGGNNLVCSIASNTNAVCDGVISIGSSLLLANHVSVSLGQNNLAAVPINSGSGTYKGASGTVTSSSIGNSNNSDLTVKLSKT